VKLAATRAQLEAAVGPAAPGDRLALRIGIRPESFRIPWLAAFGEAAVGSLLLYEDSYGLVCLAENQGDAAATLELADDEPVTIRRT
jgi:S-adenosylmethionine hydrolase